MKPQSISEGFLPPDERIVRDLYADGNAIVPVNSGGSLYSAAQKIADIGLEEYIRLQRERVENSDALLLEKEDT